MYTVVPVDDLTKVKRVHRSMLRVWVGTDPSAVASYNPIHPPEQPQSGDEPSWDCELLVLSREAPHVKHLQKVQ